MNYEYPFTDEKGDFCYRTLGRRRIKIYKHLGVAESMKLSGKFNNKILIYKQLSDNEIDNLQKTSDECYNKLTSDEKEALYDYCMGGYQDVNDYLNGKFEGYKNTKEQITNIDNAMNNYTLNQDIITYRGTNGKHYDKYKVGDCFEEKMYYSTSLNKRIAKTFVEDKENATLLEIKVPKGTKCIYVGDNTDYDFEAELLLAKNLSYKVVEKSEDKLVLEVIDEKRK